MQHTAGWCETRMRCCCRACHARIGGAGFRAADGCHPCGAWRPPGVPAPACAQFRQPQAAVPHPADAPACGRRLCPVALCDARQGQPGARPCRNSLQEQTLRPCGPAAHAVAWRAARQHTGSGRGRGQRSEAASLRAMTVPSLEAVRGFLLLHAPELHARGER